MKRAVTLGIFDGVHLGHRALLGAARATGLPVTALTFDPHPATIFAPSRVPLLLGTVAERVALLQEAGADDVLTLCFDRSLAAQHPEEFVAQTLVGRLDAGAVVVGEDFRYGCERRGDIDALREAGKRHGFSVIVVPPVFLEGVPVRSTTIRQMLLGGKVEAAARLLGRAYALTGVVVQGRQLGRTLGFPTANLSVPPGILVPAPGVYAGRAGGFLAAISVGVNVSIDESAPSTVEAHLLDFSGDLYDRPLTLELVRFLRPMQKFDALEALVAAVQKDIKAVRSALA